jgi:hypothetical protein
VKVKTKVFKTSVEAVRYTADAAVLVLVEKPNVVFYLTARHSSLPFFNILAEKNLNFSHARFVGLDVKD